MKCEYLKYKVTTKPGTDKFIAEERDQNSEYQLEYNLTLNLFPYCYPENENIAQFVFWCPGGRKKFGCENHRIEDCADHNLPECWKKYCSDEGKTAGKKAKKFIIGELKKIADVTGMQIKEENVIAWDNPATLKSIPDLFHMQVLVKNPFGEETFSKQLRNTQKKAKTSAPKSEKSSKTSGKFSK